MRPYATDWEVINPTFKNKGSIAALSYSPSLNKWYYKECVYDELSARHNGLIGPGAQFRQLLQQPQVSQQGDLQS